MAGCCGVAGGQDDGGNGDLEVAWAADREAEE